MFPITPDTKRRPWVAAAAILLGGMLAMSLTAVGQASESADAPASTAQHTHDMDSNMYDALREKIPLYRDYTNEQIDLSMLMMGPNYEAYVSGEDVQGSVGVLVLAHGFGEVGDRVFTAQLDSMAEVFPTAIGFGMSMTESGHIQAAVDDLTAAGARKIAVVPALSSLGNTLKRKS